MFGKEPGHDEWPAPPSDVDLSPQQMPSGRPRSRETPMVRPRAVRSRTGRQDAAVRPPMGENGPWGAWVRGITTAGAPWCGYRSAGKRRCGLPAPSSTGAEGDRAPIRREHVRQPAESSGLQPHIPIRRPPCDAPSAPTVRSQQRGDADRCGRAAIPPPATCRRRAPCASSSAGGQAPPPGTARCASAFPWRWPPVDRRPRSRRRHRRPRARGR